MCVIATPSRNNFIVAVAGGVLQVRLVGNDGIVYTLSVRLESSIFGGGFKLEIENSVRTKDGSPNPRAHVQGRFMSLWRFDPDISITAAHEFGHIMGFGDQYFDVGKYSTALPGHAGDIMGTGAGVSAYHLKALAAIYGN